MKRPFAFAVIFAVIGLACSHPAEAASFSCWKAETAQEKLICATSGLSKLDDRLAAQFRITLANVSSEGKMTLRASQQSWLRFIRKVCTVYDSGSDAVACLSELYERRISFLQKVVFRDGLFRIIHADRYLAIKSDGQTGGRFPGYAIWHQTFPVMDAPRNGAAKQWNAAHVPARQLTPDPFRSCTDTEELVQVTFATARFISIRKHSTETCGAVTEARLSGGAFVLTANDIRKLVPEDLFKPEARWKEMVLPAVIKSCQIAMPADLSPEIVRDIEDDVGSLNDVVMTGEGVEFGHMIDNGSFHPPHCKAQFSWQQLRPYLVLHPFDRWYDDRIQ